MEIKTREQIMGWWNSFGLEEQFYKTIEYNALIEGDHTRHPSTLTGSEIEIIYNAIHIGMNREQARDMIVAGRKMTHRYFSDGEWVTMEDGKILFEDGCKGSEFTFWLDRQGDAWNSGWFTFKEK